MDEKPIEKVPAIGASITMNISPSSQIVLQGFFPADAPEAEANEILDRMVRLAERQKAKSDIEELEKEIKQQEGVLAHFEEDFAAAEARYHAATEKRTKDIVALTAQKQVHLDKGEEEWRAGGKVGSYAPRGATKANIDREAAGIAALKADQEKADAERNQYLKQINDSRDRYNEEIASRRRGIEKRLKMIGAEPALKVAAE